MKEYNYIWTTATGEKIHIDDMTESHAKNCLKLLLRKIEDHNDSIKSEETTRERMIREMKDPNHNPFQGELASEEWDREMEFQQTGECGCESHCYCYRRFDENFYVELNK
jgi:hypothetical protein